MLPSLFSLRRGECKVLSHIEGRLLLEQHSCLLLLGLLWGWGCGCGCGGCLGCGCGPSRIAMQHLQLLSLLQLLLRRLLRRLRLLRLRLRLL